MLSSGDIVILAIPDKLIGSITANIIPRMKEGAMVFGLDPAAAYANVMPIREDLTYFVAHPTHPPLFNQRQVRKLKEICLEDSQAGCCVRSV